MQMRKPMNSSAVLYACSHREALSERHMLMRLACSYLWKEQWWITSDKENGFSSTCSYHSFGAFAYAFVSLHAVRRQEAEIHYSMRHPNIVEVIAFALGNAERPPCLVMERMHETLYDLLGVEGIKLPLAAKISIVRDICEVCSGV